MNSKVLLLLFFLLLSITPQYMNGQVCDPPMPNDTEKQLVRYFESLIMLRALY
jgi:hypothetical protein